jgi:hypothetical protein
MSSAFVAHRTFRFSVWANHGRLALSKWCGCRAPCGEPVKRPERFEPRPLLNKMRAARGAFSDDRIKL